MDHVIAKEFWFKPFCIFRCGPCKVIAPQIESMSGEMADVVFLKVDVDENEDAAQEYNISAMPTFIFVKKEAKVCII